MSEQDAVAAYDAAFARLSEIDARLWTLRGALITVSAAIKRAPDIIAFDHERHVPLPDMYGDMAIDALVWPTGPDLKAMFRDWSEARKSLLDTWQAVPERRRSSLKQPNDAPGGQNDRRRMP